MAIQKLDGAFTLARLAGADLSAKLHHFATLNSDEEIILATASTPVSGVITEGAPQGQAASIQTGNIAKVKSAGNINAGQLVASDDNGQAVVASGAGKFVAGEALNTVQAGEIVSVQLQFGRLHS